MTPQDQPLIGLWDVIYPQGMRTELLLKPDSSYSHMLLNGVQSYWGTWTVAYQNMQPYLVLTILGRDPPDYPGFNGPVQMNWPQTESLAILGVQPNQITCWGAVMLRHMLAPGTEFHPIPQPGMTGAPGFPEPTQSAPVTAAPLAPPPPLPSHAAPVPPGYAPPPVIVPPPPPAPPIAAQWQNVSKEDREKITQIQLDMMKDTLDTNLKIKKMYDDADNEINKQIADNNIDRIAEGHREAKNFITWLKTGYVPV